MTNLIADAVATPAVAHNVTPASPTIPGPTLWEDWLAKGRAADRVLDRRLRFTISAVVLGLLFWVGFAF